MARPPVSGSEAPILIVSCAWAAPAGRPSAAAIKTRAKFIRMSRSLPVALFLRNRLHHTRRRNGLNVKVRPARRQGRQEEPPWLRSMMLQDEDGGEAFRKLTGAASFVDDLRAPDAAFAVFVRSPHAHARILSVD